ncbi:hypothetical protein GW17_00053026 [Ensete ventricosum]|nr:hypothetical protein GW17_00053026 [Ensete ventricosum]
MTLFGLALRFRPMSATSEKSPTERDPLLPPALLPYIRNPYSDLVSISSSMPKAKTGPW